MQTSQNAKIHAIMLVKNEVDIVVHCLNEATRWSDFVYVYDNGSTDGTWELVNSLKDKRIIAFRQDTKPFHDGLRAEAFNANRERSREGDWWCRLDAHEIYIDDPKKFLAEVSRSRHVVWGAFIQYYLTEEDLTAIDFSLSIQEILPRIRYYNANFAEPRFFRYRERMVWQADSAWPDHLGVSEERLIRFKHYPYRSPNQIQIRMNTHLQAIKDGHLNFLGKATANWRDKISVRSGLTVDNQDGTYTLDPGLVGRHLPPPTRRLIQSFLHGIGIWP